MSYGYESVTINTGAAVGGDGSATANNTSGHVVTGQICSIGVTYGDSPPGTTDVTVALVVGEDDDDVGGGRIGTQGVRGERHGNEHQGLQSHDWMRVQLFCKGGIVCRAGAGNSSGQPQRITGGFQ